MERGMRGLIGDLGPEHDAQMGRVGEREAHVGNSDLAKLPTRVLRALARLTYGGGETRESLLRDSGEERLLAGEVPVRSGFRNPCPPGNLPQAEPPGTVL